MYTKIQTWFGMIRLGLGALRLIRDPSKLDDVIQLAEKIGLDPEITRATEEDLRQRGPQSLRALETWPRIGRVEVDVLAKMAEGTFGRAYGDFLIRNKLDPNALPKRKVSSNGEYILAHLYETHDLWHLLTGFAPDVAGEMGLQAFYMTQLPANIAYLLVAIGQLNTMIYAFNDRDARMQAIADGWTMGRAAKPLFGVEWDKMWDLPLVEVRRSLNIKIPRDEKEHLLIDNSYTYSNPALGSTDCPQGA